MKKSGIAIVGVGVVVAGMSFGAPARYEAEKAKLAGEAVVRGPTLDQADVAAQASDNAYVELAKAGAKITWTVCENGLDGITIRNVSKDNLVNLQEKDKKCIVWVKEPVFVQ